MPDEAAVLRALAVVDHLRQTAAATAPSLALLADAMAARGAKPVEIGKVLGFPAAVRTWCRDQHDLLANGNEHQQAVLADLLELVAPVDDEDQPDLHRLLVDWCRRT